MKYLDPLKVHGLNPYVVPGPIPPIEPEEDNVEEIRNRMISEGFNESSCPACELGGCVRPTNTRIEKDSVE